MNNYNTGDFRSALEELSALPLDLLDIFLEFIRQLREDRKPAIHC